MIVFPGRRSVGLKAATAFVEGRDGSDVRPKSAVPYSLDDLAQLGAIGLDREVDSQALSRPRLDRADDGYLCSSRPNQTG